MWALDALERRDLADDSGGNILSTAYGETSTAVDRLPNTVTAIVTAIVTSPDATDRLATRA